MEFFQHLGHLRDGGERSHSAHLFVNQEEEELTRERANSDAPSRLQKLRPAPIVLGPSTPIPHLHICMLDAPPQAMPAELTARLTGDDRFIQLVAIKEGLEILESVPYKDALFYALAKALDSIEGDMEMIFEDIPEYINPKTRARNSNCMLLGNIPRLLDAVRSYLNSSPRYGFTCFLEMLNPAQQVGAGKAPLTREKAMKYFLRTVLNGCTCCSFIDGWDEPRILDEFKALWAQLSAIEKTQTQKWVKEGNLLTLPIQPVMSIILKNEQ